MPTELDEPTRSGVTERDDAEADLDISLLEYLQTLTPAQRLERHDARRRTCSSSCATMVRGDVGRRAQVVRAVLHHSPSRPGERARARGRQRPHALAGRDQERPGGVNLTVASPDTRPEGYTVQLDGRTCRERVTGLTCGIVNLPPGLHELCVTAASAAGPRQVSVAIKVEPNAVLEVTLKLAPLPR